MFHPFRPLNWPDGGGRGAGRWARGFAHLGVLRELQRLHVPIRCIAGTSAGALIGGMYANGLDLDQMATDFNDANWDQMLSGRLPRTEIPYDKKRDDYKNYLDITFGLQGGQLRVPRSAINSQEIEMFIRKLTRDRQLDSFDRLPIPFRAVATDLANGEAVVFDKGRWRKPCGPAWPFPDCLTWWKPMAVCWWMAGWRVICPSRMPVSAPGI
jgi:predicted acylesterase/phospholipase RssA